MADNQGFAGMDEIKRKDIASKGGKASSGSNRSTPSRSSSNTSGAAGQTDAAKRGGQNSHRNR